MHDIYMQRCLQLAVKARGSVRTNPLVGACIVYDGKIIGEGWHKKYGEPHAEVNALDAVRNEHKHWLEEATMYVNLAPCHHRGKTGPCTLAILNSGIKKLVVGMDDINPTASGGIAFLSSEKIEVIMDVQHEACLQLNSHFITNIMHNRPYIMLKWAQSSDGFIGLPGKHIKLTGAAADTYTHYLRGQSDAILVGGQTARIDQPSLTTRHWTGSNPMRIYLSRSGEVSGIMKHQVDDQFLLVDEIYGRRHEVFEESTHRINIIQLMTRLYEAHAVGSILIEGGNQVLNQFLDLGLADEIHVLTSGSNYLANGIKAPQPFGQLVRSTFLGQDRLDYYSISHESGN